jgi:Flp pilus assembly protein TadG
LTTPGLPGDHESTRRPRPLRGRGDTGATLVEFALIIPLFALLLFATIDFGLAFGGYITLRNGVDAAARLAAVSEVDPSCTTAADPMICTIQKRVGQEFGASEVGTVHANYFFPGGSAAGNLITVCARIPLRSATGFTAPFLSGMTISASSTVRLEQTPAWTSSVTSTGSC